MQIKFRIDPKYKATELVICNDKLDSVTKQLAATISRVVNHTVTGYNDKGSSILAVCDIIRIYAANQHVITDTTQGTFTLRHKLYEIEELLPDTDIIRISKSELVNINHILYLNTSLTGTIEISLSGNIKSYVSRRNVAAIKKQLECKGGHI